jgi:ATP-dependent protease ClpP protease subunit
MSPRAVNRLAWVAVAALIAIFATQARDHFENLFIGVGRLEVRDAPEDDALYLRWRGRIDAPMADRLRTAFYDFKSKRNRVVLMLSSPGGSLTHGAMVTRLLQDIARSHQLETVVEANGRCASMCVPVYLQGERRTAAARARFMFHEVSFHEVLSDEALKVPASATASATDRLFAQFFEPAGVPVRWIREIRAAMVGGRDVWKSASELVEERAGIVQELN